MKINRNTAYKPTFGMALVRDEESLLKLGTRAISAIDEAIKYKKEGSPTIEEMAQQTDIFLRGVKSNKANLDHVEILVQETHPLGSKSATSQYFNDLLSKENDILYTNNQTSSVNWNANVNSKLQPESIYEQIYKLYKFVMMDIDGKRKK